MKFIEIFYKFIKKNKIAPPHIFFDCLFETLNKNSLGKGFDKYSVKTRKHWATAYGLIASSLVTKLSWSKDKKHTSIYRHIDSCRDWLKKNRGCHATGAPLWSVPYKRRIWDDKKYNPPGTGFMIPTCHALQALLDISLIHKSESNLNISIVKEVCNYVTTKMYDREKNGIVFWYSPMKQHSYHVTNATAMFAGQLQRVYKLTNNLLYKEKANLAIKYLLHEKIKKQNNLYGWMYFGSTKIPNIKKDKNRNNDILHEAFVCHGLMEYKHSGGDLGYKYSYNDLYNMMSKFDHGKNIKEYPVYETNSKRKDRPARLLGLGYALYVTSRLADLIKKENKKNALPKKIYEEIYLRYNNKNGYLAEIPNGRDLSKHIRDVSYVLVGLSEYIKVLKKGNS